MLSVELLELERETVLVLRGEFDLTGIDVFSDAVAGVTPRQSLVVDLRELIVHGLVGPRSHDRAARARPVRRMVVGALAPQPPVAMVLRISGLAQRLTIVQGTG